MQLIDKDVLVAKIESYINDIKFSQKAGMIKKRNAEMKITIFKSILSFINTLEVKEVDLEDGYMVDREIAREKSILDETRVEYFATGKPTIAAYSEDNLRNQFDAGADWMKEQIIKAFKEK